MPLFPPHHRLDERFDVLAASLSLRILLPRALSGCGSSRSDQGRCWRDHGIPVENMCACCCFNRLEADSHFAGHHPVCSHGENGSSLGMRRMQVERVGFRFGVQMVLCPAQTFGLWSCLAFPWSTRNVRFVPTFHGADHPQIRFLKPLKLSKARFTLPNPRTPKPQNP